MNNFIAGLWSNNPTFKQMLGLCPTLAITTTVFNGLGMGLATASVLICVNVTIALIKNLIPAKIRIPAYIVIIASFVTVVDLLMNAYVHELHKTLGLFIPLIVVNCIVLGRAESFSSKNSVGASFLDALGNGLGFTCSLTLLSSIREILGSGSFLGISLFPDAVPPVILFVLPPGAFIVLGFLMAAYGRISSKVAVQK